LSDSDTIWEDYLQIRRQISNFVVEDNYMAKERGMPTSVVILAKEVGVDERNRVEKLSED
jgi:hypothetical protein